MALINLHISGISGSSDILPRHSRTCFGFKPCATNRPVRTRWRVTIGSRSRARKIRMLGRNLGNYSVVSKIGEGGMGVVYLARHVTLGRPAAIKVLHPSLSSSQDMVTRFFNEARA